MARTRRTEFRSFGLTARPRKSRMREGISEHYWTVRCRRKGEEGEWSLGWQHSNRAAEYAFHAWVEKHRKAPSPKDGTARFVDVIERYIEMVPTTAKRPRTKENHTFRARKLLEFVQSVDINLTIADFDAALFEQYLGWMRTVKGHSPQTIQNALVGARTILKFAEAQGLVTSPPKVPAMRVPAPQHQVLYANEVEATIGHAEAPLDTLIRLMWLTGMRVSEAASTRGADLLPNERMVIVQERDGFVPKTPESTRQVPVTIEMMLELQKLVTTPDAPLFPCEVGRVYHYWRHRMRKAQRAAGVRLFTFHDLRRAVADRLRNAGVPMDQYARLMGHAPVTALRHYSTVTTDDLHKAFKAGLGATRVQDDADGGDNDE
jgi:integrase